MRAARRPGALAAIVAASMAAMSAASASAPDGSLPGEPQAVVPGYVMAFPRDHGSHPAFRTEWWYATGWLRTPAGEDLGFQITFFRSLQPAAAGNPSAFAPHQILIAHAAISDPRRGRLWKDERIARAGFGLAEAREGDAAVWIDDWRLAHPGEVFEVRAPAQDFALELSLRERQPPLLNGEAGFSRKGATPLAASYYYSLPQLEVSGHVVREGRRVAVNGTAWLDHEWSSEPLEPGAVGWDWVSVNLDDGGALMAFRIRDAQGGVRWAGGTLRAGEGGTRHFGPGKIAFTPARRWRSPRTGVEYPVQWDVRADELAIRLEPLMDDQESDTRRSTGAIYWEGAVRAYDGEREVGRGYLELTGYGEALTLR